MNFKNLSGYEREITELKNLREMLISIEEYNKKGIRIPRGVVLFGNPGVGKTKMAKAIAGDDIALVEFRAADCCQRNAAKAIKQVFKEAVEKQPAVLLIDELDKLAGTTSVFHMEANDEVKKILLQELDSLEREDAILVIATCNDLECLGDALTRSGRFDRLIEIKRPTEEDRAKILEQYFSAIDIGLQYITIENISKLSVGFTCAELECLVNELGIKAMSEKKNSIDGTDVRYVMNKMAFKGLESDPSKNGEERKKVAIHEAGHALVAMKLLPDSVVSASILPQGSSSGHIRLLPPEGKSPNIQDIENEIAIIIAGRVAERVVLGDVGIGGAADLKAASKKMMYLITKQAAYGYKYILNVKERFGEDMLSDDLKNEIAETFDAKMKALDQKAEKIIRDNEMLLYYITDSLISSNVLSREDLFDMMEREERANA